jgi:hypothetical protein
MARGWDYFSDDTARLATADFVRHRGALQPYPQGERPGCRALVPGAAPPGRALSTGRAAGPISAPNRPGSSPIWASEQHNWTAFPQFSRAAPPVGPKRLKLAKALRRSWPMEAGCGRSTGEPRSNGSAMSGATASTIRIDAIEK